MATLLCPIATVSQSSADLGIPRVSLVQRGLVLVLIAAFSLVVEVRAANVNFETYKSPLVILRPTEWTGLDFSSRKEREKFTALSRHERQTFLRDVEISPKGQAYFHGVMETFAFF